MLLILIDKLNENLSFTNCALKGDEVKGTVRKMAGVGEMEGSGGENDGIANLTMVESYRWKGGRRDESAMIGLVLIIVDD